MNIIDLLLNVKSQGLKDAKKDVDDLGKSTANAEKSAGDLGKAFKEVGGPLGNASSKIGDVKDQLSGASSAMRLFGTGLSTVLGGLAAVGAAVVAVERIGFAANKAADDADELAQKLGITIARLETLKLIANENGSSVEALQRTYDKLSKSMNKLDEDNNKTELAFKALVLTTKDLAGLTEREIAGVVIKRWQELGQTSKATAATAQILGASFRDNIPAILAAADATSEYSDRIRTFAADATPDLVKAGGLQEKAMSNLGLAWQGLSNEVARWSANMLTTITNWAASALNSIRSVLAEFRNAQNQTLAAQASISDKRRGELVKQARNEVYDGSNPNATEGDVNKRLKELMAQEQQMNFRKFEASQSADTYAGVAAAEKAKKLQAESAKVNMGAKAPGAAKAEKDPDAEIKRLIESLNGQALAQDNLNKEELIWAEIAKDKYDKASGLLLIEALGIAQKIDDANRTKMLADSTKSLLDVSTQYVDKLTDEQLQMTMNKRDYEAMIATRRIDLELQNALNAAKEKGLLTDQLQAQLTAQAAIAKAQVTSGAAGAKKTDEEAATFGAGWQKAFEDYKKNATDAAANGAQAFQAAQGLMTDALTNFVLTGKLGFKEFLAGFLKMIAGILAKWAVLNVLSYATGGGPVPLSKMFAMAKGGAFEGGVQKFANGGVVTKPTTFGMAGGKMGLMGEAGPEAIMPLGRTSSGKLGVVAAGGGNNVTVQQNVTINGNIKDEETQAKFLREMAKQSENIARRVIVDERRRGGTLQSV